VDRNSASDFKFNPETEFVPILGLVQSQLNENVTDSDSEAGAPTITSNIAANHSPAVLSLIAQEASVDVQAIHDFELYDKK
jgi:aspartyl aminopeptidase